MCIACVHDPFGYMETVKSAAAEQRLTARRILELEAKHLKDVMDDIGDVRKLCPSGADLAKRIQERQYEIARSL